MTSTLFEPQLLLFYAVLLIGLFIQPWSKKRKNETGSLKILGILGWALIVISSLMILTAINSHISGIIFLGLVIFLVIWIIYEVFRFFSKRRN
jgi:cobalamin biosynthesis protein CobD/CbiB